MEESFFNVRASWTSARWCFMGRWSELLTNCPVVNSWLVKGWLLGFLPPLLKLGIWKKLC